MRSDHSKEFNLCYGHTVDFEGDRRGSGGAFDGVCEAADIVVSSDA